jgi:hypothetical protein
MEGVEKITFLNLNSFTFFSSCAKSKIHKDPSVKHGDERMLIKRRYVIKGERKIFIFKKCIDASVRVIELWVFVSAQ